MQRDRKLCLVIRIGDLRDDNFILGTQVGIFIKTCILAFYSDIHEDSQTQSN